MMKSLMSVFPRFLVLSLGLAVGLGLLDGPAGSAFGQAATSKPLKVLALGDSITKAVRPGVAPTETFESYLESELTRLGFATEVVNAGIGGERTDQALKRLEELLRQHQPRVVLIMYGANDSYVDQGAKSSRLSAEGFEENLVKLARQCREQGAQPILMTSPRYAPKHAPNGLGEDPDVRLAEYMTRTRAVARELGLPLVDHHEHWARALAGGFDIQAWTTDGLHPNPRGHQELANVSLPVVLAASRGLSENAGAPRLVIAIRATRVQEDRSFQWYHPRAALVPGRQPLAVMTLQKHLNTSDHYSGLFQMMSDDRGTRWTGPEAIPSLDWRTDSRGVTIAVADVTPGWHAASGKMLAIGAQVRYSKKGEQMEDSPRSHQTAYAVFDPKDKTWTGWNLLEMPGDPVFEFARSACAQFVVEPDGSLLLPFYVGPNAREPYRVAVVRATFDGRQLRYRAHGPMIEHPVDRGIYEPSLIRSAGAYYLTLRTDRDARVARSEDGLHFDPPRLWRFDDGSHLECANTQQHWLSLGPHLYLVYTRVAIGNAHIARHRAPLFLSRVDPATLRLIRASEQIVIPERGGEFGNFGVNVVRQDEAWITVGEGIWSEENRRRGALGALFVVEARLQP